jgi:hypothetical protein
LDPGKILCVAMHRRLRSSRVLGEETMMLRTLRSLTVGLFLAGVLCAQSPRGWDAVSNARDTAARNEALAAAHRLALADAGGVERLVLAEEAFLRERGTDAAVEWWLVEGLLQMRRLSNAEQRNSVLLAKDPMAAVLSAQQGDIALRAFDTATALTAWQRAGELRASGAEALRKQAAAQKAVRTHQWIGMGAGLVMLVLVCAILLKHDAATGQEVAISSL